MNRPLFAALFAAALVAQAVSAGDGLAEPGRYQLIPKVPVPSQSGQTREQAVLLDTETGQTWRLVRGAKKGKPKGAHWAPMDLVFPEDLNPETASTVSRGAAKNPRALEAKAPRKTPADRRFDEDYDDDP